MEVHDCERKGVNTCTGIVIWQDAQQWWRKSMEIRPGNSKRQLEEERKSISRKKTRIEIKGESKGVNKNDKECERTILLRKMVKMCVFSRPKRHLFIPRRPENTQKDPRRPKKTREDPKRSEKTPEIPEKTSECVAIPQHFQIIILINSVQSLVSCKQNSL